MKDEMFSLLLTLWSMLLGSKHSRTGAKVKNSCDAKLAERFLISYKIEQIYLKFEKIIGI